MKDDPISICTECKGAVKRLFYPVGIVFKGTGWYVNDSRAPEKSEGGSKSEEPKSSDSKTEGASDKKSETGAEPKSETKSETKPEIKTETKTETKSESASTPAANK